MIRFKTLLYIKIVTHFNVFINNLLSLFTIFMVNTYIYFRIKNLEKDDEMMNKNNLNNIRFNVVNYITNIIGLENLLIFEEKKSEKKRIIKKIHLYYDLINKEISPLKKENISIKQAFPFLNGEYYKILKKAIKYHENK